MNYVGRRARLLEDREIDGFLIFDLDRTMPSQMDRSNVQYASGHDDAWLVALPISCYSASTSSASLGDLRISQALGKLVARRSERGNVHRLPPLIPMARSAGRWLLRRSGKRRSGVQGI